MGNAFFTYDDQINGVVDRVIDLPWELGYKIRMREIEPGRDIRITVRERADNRTTGVDPIGCRILLTAIELATTSSAGLTRESLCVYLIHNMILVHKQGCGAHAFGFSDFSVVCA